MKKITTKINDFITYIMFIIENCVSAIGEDKMLLGFLIAGIIPNFIIKVNSGMAWFNLRSLIFNFAWYSLFVAFSFYFKKTRTRVLFLSIVTLVIFILTYSNIMYYRYYESFLSLSLVKQLSLFGDVADATSVGISAFDVIYWVLLLVSIGLISFLSIKKTSVFDNKEREVRKFNRLNFFKMALISLVVGILTLAPGNYSQAEKMWNRPIVVENFGLYNYHIIDVVKSIGIFFEHKPTETDYQTFMNYFDDKNTSDAKNNNEKNDYTDIFKGKNVIVIHAESLESFVMNQKVNGMEITPNFNEIANTGLYFSNFYTQQSIGTSADSEFVFNTSLLPVNNGTVFLTHFDRTYNATPKELRDNGYFTMYMHGNKASFWNRRLMYPVLGYDVFFSEDEYHVTESNTIGLGISDEAFFDQSTEFIMNAPKPYYATLISLSNHTPWKDVSKYVTYDKNGNEQPQIDCPSNIDGTTVCRYLKSVHYFDWAFGQFVDHLKALGVWDDTVLVIYGDHPASLPQSEMEDFYGENMSKVEYDASKHTPFIIWSPSLAKPQEITKVMGEFDVGPTLQNMLGIPKNQFALGHDIFSIDSNLVPFINGDWVDDTIYYDSFRDDYYIKDPNVSADMITKDYIKQQSATANKIIDMSNMINRLDLIAYYEQKNNITHKPMDPKGVNE